MIRKPEKYCVDDVLMMSGNKVGITYFFGDLIKMSSQRFELFKKKGCKCVVCGIEGKYFTKDRFLDQSRYHLNLYAVKNGKEVLMTKDHIIPKSKGGKDKLWNYQTMCSPCNAAKGNKL